jgi:hypothetical protein
MPESVRQRAGVALPPGQTYDDLFKLWQATQADLEQIRNLLATHVHSGITAGGANSGAPTVTITAAALNLQP